MTFCCYYFTVTTQDTLLQYPTPPPGLLGCISTVLLLKNANISFARIQLTWKSFLMEEF